jgi:RNA polymerase subunit RPABC4/transcription elongation factor Spt4
MRCEYDHIRRSKMAVAKVVKVERPIWLSGKVKLHCIRCEAVVGQEEEICPNCSAPLRKQCAACHYWADMDVTTCASCRTPFPLPPRPKATVKMWHPDEGDISRSGAGEKNKVNAGVLDQVT